MMAAREGGGVEEETATIVAATSAPGSPKNKVKFMCSHGGKILPRPTDGLLKYVGGQTRVVSVPRDINISELMKKLASLSDGHMVLKYQLIPEDLDALVTVKSNEDLRHMFNEYDRYGSTGSPKLRAFLFPANPIVVENTMSSLEPQALEQRYIDAVNGIVRAYTATIKLPSIHGNPPSGGLSPAGSSPKSPDSCTMETTTNYETFPIKGNQNRRRGMHRVHSSPSISSLDSQHQNNNPPSNPQYHQQQYHPKPPHHQGCLSPRAQPSPDRLFSIRSVGRADSWKYQLVPSPVNYYLIGRHSRGSRWCYCSKCTHFDDRADSAFRSPPLSRSPM